MDRRRRALLVLGIFAAVVLPAGPAGAHARYERSDPPDKGTVSAPPSSVWAEFSEPPASSSYLRVYDACGRRVDDGSSDITGYRVTVGTNASAAGVYRVDWWVLSTLDGHPTSGTFTFTATGGDECPGSRQEEPQPREREERPRREGGGGGGDGGGGGSPSEVAAAGEGREERGAAGRGRGERQRRDVRDRPGRGGGDRAPAAAAQPEAPPAPPPEEMPLDGLLVGLGLAALIGAAGGYVYAGIMGPKP